jgi:hypothetical protein
VLSATLNAEEDKRQGEPPTAAWNMQLLIYCESQLGVPVIYPWHRASISFRVGTVEGEKEPRLTGHAVSAERPDPSVWVGSRVTRATIHTGADQLIVEGPGRFSCTAWVRAPMTDDPSTLVPLDATLDLRLEAVDADQPQRVVVDLVPVAVELSGYEDADHWRARWAYNPER